MLKRLTKSITYNVTPRRVTTSGCNKKSQINKHFTGVTGTFLKSGTKGLSGLKAKHFGKNTFCRFKIVGLWFRQISVEHLDERLGASVSSVGRLAACDGLPKCRQRAYRRRLSVTKTVTGNVHFSSEMLCFRPERPLRAPSEKHP